MRRLLPLLPVLLALLYLPINVQAQATLTVTNLADNGAGSLRDQITFAAPGDTIEFIVSGTITLTSGQLAITTDLNIVGPSAGNITIDGNNFVRVFDVAPGTTVVIDGLTMLNGDNLAGGGIYNAGTLILNNSTVTGNRSIGNGGGIYNEGSLTINNSTFAGNDIMGNGGGIYSDSGSVTVSNSTFAGNDANDGGGIYINTGSLEINNSIVSGNNPTGNNGGGVYVSAGTLTINDSTFSGNNAGARGGGLYANSGGTINNSSFTGNDAAFSGGGIHVEGGTLTVNNSEITNNLPVFDGGGIYNASTLIVNNSTISGNTASGGAVYNAFGAGPVTINNSTISGNTSGFAGGAFFQRTNLGLFTINNSTISGNDSVIGGGLYVESGEAVINSSTFSDNQASDGAAIFMNSDVEVNNSTFALNGSPTATIRSGGGDLSFNNSIVADTVNGADMFLFSGNVLFQGANIVEDGSVPGPGVLTGDPNLGPLADNGGPTLTHFPLAGSVAIDSANNATCPIGTDQRGAQRIVNGTCDIGAVETGATVPTLNFSIDETTLTETGGISSATITVTLSGYAGENIVVSLAQAGSAIADDYTLSVDNLTFSGNGSQIITVTAIDDGIDEGDEILDLELLILGLADIVGSATDSVTIRDTPLPPPLTPPLTPPMGMPDAAAPAIVVFDPAISKLGLLVPGQVGVTDEQLEWVVTVRNVGGVGGQNVIITDRIDDRMQINRVDAPGAAVNISGQTVNVAYPTLAVGETVTFSIFTTVVDGESVSNTACVMADNQAGEECATGSSVFQLPDTGEAFPWGQMFISSLLTMLLAMLLVFGAVLFLRKAG